MSQEIEQLYKNKLIAALESAISAGNMPTVETIAGTPGISLVKRDFYLAVVKASLGGNSAMVDYAILNEETLRVPASDDTARLCKHWIDSNSYQLRWKDPEQCPYQSLIIVATPAGDLAEQFSKKGAGPSPENIDKNIAVPNSMFFKSESSVHDGGKKTGSSKLSVITTVSSSS